VAQHPLLVKGRDDRCLLRTEIVIRHRIQSEKDRCLEVISAVAMLDRLNLSSLSSSRPSSHDNHDFSALKRCGNQKVLVWARAGS
jgi:hypothetical protein